MTKLPSSYIKRSYEQKELREIREQSQEKFKDLQFAIEQKQNEIRIAEIELQKLQDEQLKLLFGE